jgi:hypothetical protein
MNPLLRGATAVLSIFAGLMHWDIWANHGYRSTPVRELIIASAVIGVIVGSIAFVNNQRAALPAATANAVFLGAFALSRLAELPTFHGGWSETGLAPTSADIGGISTTLLIVLAEALAVVCALASLRFGRAPRPTPLPAAFARVNA